MRAVEFKDHIAASDVTDDDINRLQIECLYGRILKKDDRREISQTLGVLREILREARKNNSNG